MHILNLNHKSSFIRSFAQLLPIWSIIIYYIYIWKLSQHFQYYILYGYKPFLNQNADIIMFCSYTVELTIAMVYLKGQKKILQCTTIEIALELFLRIIFFILPFWQMYTFFQFNLSYFYGIFIVYLPNNM